jgi:hypothetical protein
VLVEGTKDVLAIQQFLRLYGKDHQIVLLPLGGSALINGSHETALQLEELKRISDNISAVIDSERDNQDAELGPDRASFVRLCEGARIRCHVLVLLGHKINILM